MPFVFGWLLSGVYLIILLVAAPILLFRRVTQGKYRRGWGEKLTGQLTRRSPKKNCLWFHAVSVGEVLQLQKLLEETEAKFPEAELFVTVTTETGYDVAKSKYPRYTVSYFPLDFSWAVQNALTSVRPDLIVLVELELWPNLILTARRNKIPLLLINGRIGEKSYRGYSRLKPLMRRLLSCFDVLAVQSKTYAQRLISLGAPADRVTVTGNIKFDRVESNRDNPKTSELRSSFQLHHSDTVFIAGSTQDPEESYAIDTWLALRGAFPQLRLVIVPRHKERFEDVAKLITQKGCGVIRRSAVVSKTQLTHASDGSTDKPVVALLDTLGELAACWGLAEIAFVGGSLTNRGGQNMIEPAGYGAAVLFGPNTWNFKDVTEALLMRDAARVVAGPQELLLTVQRLLEQPDEAKRQGIAARTFVASQHGATQRTLELIEKTARSVKANSTSAISKPSSGLGKNRFWFVLKWFLFAMVFLFVGRRAVQLWESAPPKSVQIKWSWLISASIFYAIGFLPSVWFWRALLSRMGQRLDWRNAIRAHFVGQLGKYIPGKGLVLVIRASLAKEAGVDPLLAGITSAYETLVLMATGAAIFLAVAPLGFTSEQWNCLPSQMRWLRSQPLIFATTVAVITFATTPFSSWLFSHLGRKAISRRSADEGLLPSISAGLISQGVAITSIGWACHAISLGCVLQAVTQDPIQISHFPVWLVASSFATVGGFVALFAPGGLGIREGLLIESIKDHSHIGASTAVIAAWLLRAVGFVTELICATVLYFMKPKT